MRTSELYLRLTEQKRSAFNINEIMPLMYSESRIPDNAYESVDNRL
jgi:hypothetical protein